MKKKEEKQTVKKTSKTKKTKEGKVGFLKEVKQEMKRVSWPDSKYMIKYTTATICFVIFFALGFYVVNVIVAIMKAWLR